MRILLLSDTHGDVSPLRQLKERLLPLDALFHLGDCCRDAREAGLYLGCPVYQVKGNCDRGEDEPEELCFTLGGKRFLLLHGHTCSSMLAMKLKGERARADAVCFGHTHVPCVERCGSMLLLNPGSLTLPRYCSAPGCMLLTDEGGVLRAERIEL